MQLGQQIAAPVDVADGIDRRIARHGRPTPVAALARAGGKRVDDHIEISIMPDR
jgi:hypothetical protein